VKHCTLKPSFYICVAHLFYSDLCLQVQWALARYFFQTSANKPRNQCKQKHQHLCVIFLYRGQFCRADSLKSALLILITESLKSLLTHSHSHAVSLSLTVSVTFTSVTSQSQSWLIFIHLFYWLNQSDKWLLTVSVSVNRWQLDWICRWRFNQLPINGSIIQSLLLNWLSHWVMTDEWCHWFSGVILIQWLIIELTHSVTDSESEWPAMLTNHGTSIKPESERTFCWTAQSTIYVHVASRRSRQCRMRKLQALQFLELVLDYWSFQ